LVGGRVINLRLRHHLAGQRFDRFFHLFVSQRLANLCTHRL
tara:strand:- start:79998 stop:80120 length:123 start_codon:yes stop_codon:yes gene_type:complete